MSDVDYFPAGLAKFPRFCNRVSERRALERNIALGRHTVVISPRRYGKSSLVRQVTADVEGGFVSVDLFLAHNDQAVTRRLLKGVSQAVSMLIPSVQKYLGRVQQYFRRFNVVLNAQGFGLELSQEFGRVDPIEQIFEALQSLAKLVDEKKKKFVFFIDEFQDLIEVENSKAIQGAIRHVAQESDALVFVFSGSSRHLLMDLFDDSHKPLYMLCDKLFLTRMTSKDYLPYIQDAAVDFWEVKIKEVVLNRIFFLTELHPFYLNLLCNELWKQENPPETQDEVDCAWEYCYQNEKRRLLAEIEKLSKNQKIFLKVLSENPTKEPTSKSFLQILGLSISSARQSFDALLEKDFVYRVEREEEALPTLFPEQIRVLDPLLSYALKTHF